MKEYTILYYADYHPAKEVEIELNNMAQDGWRVVCDSKLGLIMERDKPIPEPKYTFTYTAFPDKSTEK